MLPSDIARSGLQAMAAITGLAPVGVVGLHREGDCWQLSVELIEKESIPRGMDVLGLYEAHLDAAGNVLDFQRVGLRRRGDVS